MHLNMTSSIHSQWHQRAAAVDRVRIRRALVSVLAAEGMVASALSMNLDDAVYPAFVIGLV